MRAGTALIEGADMDNRGFIILAVYLAVVNVIALAVYGWDKLCAKAQRRRVSEAALFALAAVGGSVGAWLAMQIFRHKTLHLKFKYGVPAILALQLAAAAGAYMLLR